MLYLLAFRRLFHKFTISCNTISPPVLCIPSSWQTINFTLIIPTAHDVDAIVIRVRTKILWSRLHRSQ